MSRLIKIYTLSHPETGEIYYVGATVRLLKHRAIEHTYSSHSRPIFLEKGLRPTIEAIEEVPANEAADAEAYWLEQFRAWGFKMKNRKNNMRYRVERLGVNTKRKLTA